MKRMGLAALALAAMLACHEAAGGELSASGYDGDVKVTPLLKTATTTLGQAIKYPLTEKPEVTALEVEIPPGKETGWHKHPVPGYAYILSGTLTIEMEGDKQLQLSSGTAFVEVINTLHNGKNLGTGPVKILVFFAGAAGEPVTITVKHE